MEFEFREYKKITFPVRDCTWTRYGVTRNRLVGSEVMNSMLWGKNEPVDDEARQVDCGIAYYIPHELLITGSDDEILDYIFREIEQSVMDIFEED